MQAEAFLFGISGKSNFALPHHHSNTGQNKHNRRSFVMTRLAEQNNTLLMPLHNGKLCP